MYDLTKRWFDAGVAAIILALFAPVLALAAAGAWLSGLRPVVFRQQRTGWREQAFYILKLRTMTQTTDSSGQLLPDHERLTAFGRFLRRASLDEVPQLWNVLRGELSLVGPRPFLHDYLPLYTPAQRQRFGVRPGITGWAQIHGRNALSWEQKFAYDRWYVAHRGWRLDLLIILRTVRQLFSAHAKSAHVPAARFTGSPPQALTS